MLQNRKFIWSLLAAGAALAFFVAAYPMYVIRPFRAQGANELDAALLVKGWSLPLSAFAAMAALFCTVILWRGGQRVGTKVLCAADGFATVVFAGLSQVNVFERMFHRIDAPEAMPAAEANLERDDMVLAIGVKGEGRAYPIRMMAYHHIVNDWAGDTPIVATY